MLFGRTAWLAHVHSLIWFGALLAIVLAIFRRTMRPTVAGVAGLLYAAAGAHATTTCWLAARHALVGAAFGGLFVLLHLRWRQEGDRRFAWLAPLALVLGVFGSETALGAVVFVVLYEAIARRDALGRRALACVPALVIGLSHLTFYATGGYGAAHSGLYISPISAPLEFAAAAVERTPILLGELYGAFPSLISGALDGAGGTPILVGYGLLSTAVVFGLLFAARARTRSVERRRLLWLGLASCVSLLPMVGGVLGGRLLPLALIGSSAVLGAALVYGWCGGRLSKLAIVGLLVTHVGIGGLARLGLPLSNGMIGGVERELASGLDTSACPDGARVYLLTGADPAFGMFLPAAVVFYRPELARDIGMVRLLSMAGHDQRMNVIDAHSFDLEIVDSPRVANMFERLHRDTPLAAGDEVRADGYRVEVLETDDGYWSRVRVTTDRPLAAACFARWDGEQVIVERAPEPGNVRPLPHLVGPMGL